MSWTIEDLPDTEAAYTEIGVITDTATPPGGWIAARTRRQRDHTLRAHGSVARRVARVDGRIVGHVGAWPLVSYAAPGRRFWHLSVLPAFQGQGIGRALYADLRARLEGVTELITQVSDQVPRGLVFVEGRGGVLKEVELELAVDLTGLDAAALAALRARESVLTAAGYTVTTLAAIKETTPDWLVRLHALYTGLDGDTPAPVAYNRPSLQAWAEMEVYTPDALHTGYFIAHQGDEWVALSELRRPFGRDKLYQDLTGVLPRLRRQGYATALKARCVRWAHEQGFTAIHTWNDEINHGMIKANESVGFRPVQRWHFYVTRLDGPA